MRNARKALLHAKNFLLITENDKAIRLHAGDDPATLLLTLAVHNDEFDTPSKPSSIKPMKLSEIKPNAKNPRIIKDEKFQEAGSSIGELPEMLEARPIRVNSTRT